MISATAPVPVIVNVSSSGSMDAWIGLAGVVVGALATGGLNGWLAWLAARRDRRRALDDAISDLQASAHTFVITFNVSRGVPGEQRFVLYQNLLSTQLDRMVRAAEVIARVARDKHLPRLADTYVDAAVSYMDPAANGVEFEEALAQLTKARDEFTAFSREER